MIEERCNRISKCYNGTMYNCEGCNIWNLNHDKEFFENWCFEHNENVEEMTERIKKNYLTGDKQICHSSNY